MSIAPKSQKDFADPLYWKKFFEKHDAPFEWYGDFSQLSHILEKYLKCTDSILQIGCGNSLLSEQLYDNGFRNVRSIDTDYKVIKRHKDSNFKKRPELVFECASAADTGLPDASINIVLDKGTTDALLPVDFTSANQQLLSDVFTEAERCLVPLGRLIIVTLAQSHIIQAIVGHFLPTRRALIRVQKCELADKEFVMPVFILIITKLKMPLPHVPQMEFVRELTYVAERVSDCEALVKLIEAEQELNWFKHYVSKNIVDDVFIQICNKSGQARYQLTIVDNLSVKLLRTMAVFIVPLGREADWVFSTAKGRKILRKECDCDRIIVVGLIRNQIYNSVQHIQDELSGLVSNLKPIGFGQNKINFLSLDAVDATDPIACGTSALNGEWSVEQVKHNGKTYRRLIFLSSAGLIQSEAEIIEGRRRKQFKIKSDLLTCDHHRSMLTAINFVSLKKDVITGKEIFSAREERLHMAVLGLGGGLFPRFLRENFPQAAITTVELDSDVLGIAQKYFGLPQLSDKFKIVIDDAQNFLNDVSIKEDNNKYDVIFVDLAGPIQSDGISCPPANFVTNDSLMKMKKCLRNRGVLSFNLVTRDEEKSRDIKKCIRDVFSIMYTISSEEDVNEVIICPLLEETLKTISLQLMDLKEEKIEWIKCHWNELKKLSISK